MLKIKLSFSIFVLIFSLGLASFLMSADALAQCSWMDGLSMVQGFNNVHVYDYRWHYSNPALESCSLCGQAASPAKDPPPTTRPSVNKAVRGDTCPSAYDIDCTGCPSAGPYCSLRSYAPGPGPG